MSFIFVLFTNAPGFLEYFASLDTSCASNESLLNATGNLVFTPDQDTPDLIYYQSVTNPNLGWRFM